MAHTKEPITHSVAGSVIDLSDESGQPDLFAPPQRTADGNIATDRSTAGRSVGTDMPSVGSEDSEAGSVMNAPEEKPVRRRRINTPVHVTAIKRMIKAATKAGLAVTTIQARADGTIVLSTEQAVARPAAAPDVFEQWADRL